MEREMRGELPRKVRTVEDFHVGQRVQIKVDNAWGEVTAIEGGCVVVKDLDGEREGGWYPDSLLPRSEWLRVRMEIHMVKARAYRDLMFEEDAR